MINCILLIFSLAAAGSYAALAESVTVWGLLGVFALGYLAANLLFVLFLTVVSLLLPRLGPDEGIEKQHRLCRWLVKYGVHWLLFFTGVRARVSGLEKMPEGPFLYVSNHRSGFDPLLAMDYLRDYNISFISKPSNLQIPIVGPIVRHAGYLAIDRENNREALKTILLAADYLKRGVCNIGIYPEGTRSRTGELLPFHAGSFKIAQRAGSAVVVACTYGAEKGKRRSFPFGTAASIEILETIDAERARSMSSNELAEEARSLIERRLQEIGQ